MCNKSLIGYANDLFDGLNLGHVCAFDPEGNSDACSVNKKLQQIFINHLLKTFLYNLG